MSVGVGVRRICAVGAASLLAACSSLEPCPPPAFGPVIQSYMAFFDFDSIRVTPQALSTVRKVARDLKEYGDSRVAITAHTDGSGEALGNLILSYRRAAALRNALIAEGVGPTRIRIQARGDEFPLVQTAAREPQNRRAEFTISRSAPSTPPQGWRRESYSCIDTRERTVQDK